MDLCNESRDDLGRIVQHEQRIGAVRLPWQFYFKGRPLTGTIWGGKARAKRFLVHRDRCDIQKLNHRSAVVRDGYIEHTIERDDYNAVIHHWSPGFWDLLEKHIRYIRHEGEALYRDGYRINWRIAAARPWREFRRSLIDYDGWRAGLTGIALSLFYGVYTLACAGSLLAYQLRHPQHDRTAEQHPDPRRQAA